MWFFIAFFVLLFVGILDGHISSVVAMLLVLVLGFWSVNSTKTKAEKACGSKVFGIVFIVYVISAFIASKSFLNGQFFFVSDSVKYIEKFSNVNTLYWEDHLFSLAQTYFFLDDSNGLFNVSFSIWSYIANHYFHGTSVFYMTLFQTLFGVLASLEIYKIFSLYFESPKAAKYSWTFAILSLFHIYSILIIRDIVITYFYMLGLRKIMGKPKVTDIFVLLALMIITIGIRLYSGLFFGAFIMIWLYRLVNTIKFKKYKILLVPIILVGIVIIVKALALSGLTESTSYEIGYYDELHEGNSGFAARLRGLPIGIRQIVALFFSQLPLESSNRLFLANSFSNYYLGFLVIVYQLFGFVIFYGLLYHCFIKKSFARMELYDKLILITMLLFVAITLSTHMDLRRSMAATPFFYLYYKLISEKYHQERIHRVKMRLVLIGSFMMIAYMIVK